MLPKINRLTKKEDFEAVKKEGRKIQGSAFGLLFRQTANHFSRFGFVFSTKLSKRATVRNRAKRLFREAVRKLLPRIKPGYDFIILGKKEAIEKSYAEVVLEVERMLKKGGLFQ